ncbi:hypothetical protein A8C75_10780 [Marinobacterium aestuarii]|uniref:Nucleotide pyrophosphatase n=1 Tax=Marinobacterium aestuarii TaxID=1821621 RepID=A0A1A9EZK1_9GAMM|nr:alkaline phosphatase family protein [Marinobacterium aestuarii]ANG62923.1 hypothetical protein A8C75_10780 [Marinobacterium aestuarii]
MKKRLLTAICIALSSTTVWADKQPKVLLIGLDGVQYEQLLEASTPNLDTLDIQLGFTGGIQGTNTEQATYSGPSWSTILTGTWANKHGVYNNSDRIANPNIPSLFKVLSDQQLSVATLVNWANPIRDYFTYDLPLMDFAYYSDTKHETLDHYRIQDEKLSHMFGRVLERHSPDFTFVHLDHVDDIGHELGLGAEYSQGIEALDAYIGTMTQALSQRINEDWLIIVTTDHGRSPKDGGKSHGEQSRQERSIWIAANRPLRKTGDSSSTEASLADIAPTVYDFLGVDTASLDLDGRSLLLK